MNKTKNTKIKSDTKKMEFLMNVFDGVLANLVTILLIGLIIYYFFQEYIVKNVEKFGNYIIKEAL